MNDQLDFDILPTEAMQSTLVSLDVACLSPLAEVFVPGNEDWPVLPFGALGDTVVPVSVVSVVPVVSVVSVPTQRPFLAKPKTRKQGRARSLRV